ncbi:hypothetical protein, partial [Micromonospora craterilacus]|uniref:hypothetical protein n=1 Tax=Micromonospora craterilacus TaxID=1655439 RepID=UPI001F490160
VEGGSAISAADSARAARRGADGMGALPYSDSDHFLPLPCRTKTFSTRCRERKLAPALGTTVTFPGGSPRTTLAGVRGVGEQPLLPGDVAKGFRWADDDRSQ